MKKKCKKGVQKMYRGKNVRRPLMIGLKSNTLHYVKHVHLKKKKCKKSEGDVSLYYF